MDSRTTDNETEAILQAELDLRSHGVNVWVSSDGEGFSHGNTPPGPDWRLYAVVQPYRASTEYITTPT